MYVFDSEKTFAKRISVHPRLKEEYTDMVYYLLKRILFSEKSDFYKYKWRTALDIKTNKR